MTRGRLTRCIVAGCVVGLTLTTQLGAQLRASADSLGLQALNRNLQITSLLLSFELTRGVLNDSAPELRPLGAGMDHVVWGRFQHGEQVAVELTFRRDSGEMFRRAVTRHATPESINARAAVQSAEIFLRLAPKFRDAVAILGPPEFCERDTMVSDRAGAIFLSSMAMWKRGDVTVLFGLNFNARDPLPKNREFAPRFSIAYGAWRGTNTLSDPVPVTRHDSPCIYSDDEIQEHAAPLDSIAYEAWRARLRKMSP